MDHLIPARKPDRVLINKKKRFCHLLDFCRSSEQQSENKRRRKDRQIPGSSQRAEKVVKHEGDSDTIYNWRTLNGPQRFAKETEGIGNQGKNRDYPDSSIVKIG